MSDLERILKLAGMNGLYETDVEQAQVREIDSIQESKGKSYTPVMIADNVRARADHWSESFGEKELWWELEINIDGQWQSVQGGPSDSDLWRKMGVAKEIKAQER